MANSSARNFAYSAGQSDVSGDDGRMQDLLASWARVEAKAMELANYSDLEMSGGDLAASAQVRLVQLSHELEREQHDILKDFATTPASGTAGLLAKLRIWKSMTCPSREDENYLQPADLLVLSVLNDLTRLENLS